MRQTRAMIFIDKLAKENLAAQGVTPREILREAGRIYQENGILFGYSLNHLPARKWNNNSPIASRIDDCFDLLQIIFDGAEKVCCSPGCTKSWLEYDVCIFFTGHLFTGFGCSMRSGIIMLGTRNPASAEIRRNLFDRLFRKFFWKCLLDCLLESSLYFNFRPLIYYFPYYFRSDYLKRLSSLLVHEQGHVCGLGHVRDVNSIMYQCSLAAEVFDPVSKRALKRSIF